MQSFNAKPAAVRKRLCQNFFLSMIETTNNPIIKKAFALRSETEMAKRNAG